MKEDKSKIKKKMLIIFYKVSILSFTPVDKLSALTSAFVEGIGAGVTGGIASAGITVGVLETG